MRKIILFILFIQVFQFQAAAQGSVTPGDFSGSMSLYLNTTYFGANIAGDVSDFPIVVRLTADNFADVFSGAKDGGADIRFTKADGTSRLYHEIASWDPSGQTAQVWVLMDEVPGNSITEIKMYWGNSGASSLSEPAQVFSSSNGFAGVWHLEESGDGTEGEYKDATGNNDGQGGAGTANKTPEQVDGVIGKGQRFDGDNDYINLGIIPLGDKSGTIYCWYKVAAAPLNKEPQGLVARSYQKDGLLLANDEDTDYGGKRRFSKGEWATIYVYGFPYVTNWRQMAGTASATTAILYENGDPFGQKACTNDWDGDDNKHWHIGASSGWDDKTDEANFEGTIDEVRLVTGVRSHEWLKLCYMNQKADDALVQLTPGTAPVTPVLSVEPSSVFSLTATASGVRFTIPSNDLYRTSLRLYDIRGQLIQTLHDNHQSGAYQMPWSGVPSAGVYFIRMKAEKGNRTVFNDSKKVILIR